MSLCQARRRDAEQLQRRAKRAGAVLGVDPERLERPRLAHAERLSMARVLSREAGRWQVKQDAGRRIAR
jgi:hypothetical protein